MEGEKVLEGGITSTESIQREKLELSRLLHIKHKKVNMFELIIANHYQN